MLDSEELVAILPSEHLVRSRPRLVMSLGRAFALAARLGSKVVLLAASPGPAEPGYGWIEPGGLVTAAALSARTVAGFHEKPGLAERGFLRNTGIMVAKARTFQELGRRNRLRRTADLSRDILAHSPEDAVVLPLCGVD